MHDSVRVRAEGCARLVTHLSEATQNAILIAVDLYENAQVVHGALLSCECRHARITKAQTAVRYAAQERSYSNFAHF